MQRAQVFHDSLDDVPKSISALIGQSQGDGAQEENKTRVMNEDGQLLEVIFDPVLKCYYEPTQHQYYALKDLQLKPSTAQITEE